MDHALYAYSALPQRPVLRWPEGHRLAFWVILYLEHWELDPPAGSYRPPGIQGVRESIFPDYRTCSHRDYGNRVGVFRLIDAFDELGIRPTVALNAAVCQESPRVVQACLDRGWEIAAHGTHATRMITSRMTEAEEREHIESSLEEVSRFTGRRPRGWIGQEFGESTRTVGLVAGHGLSYIADWPNDEQPYPMMEGHRLVSLPQQAQWDDVQLLWMRKASSARYPGIVREACDVLLEEGAIHGRMLGLGVHPWLSGQAHRIKHLRAALADVMSRRGVWHADGQGIADYYVQWLGRQPEKEQA
jgi:peptidoglycan/xylan/chitin deacetylase (PgdA/CDA1 family)